MLSSAALSVDVSAVIATATVDHYLIDEPIGWGLMCVQMSLGALSTTTYVPTLPHITAALQPVT